MKCSKCKKTYSNISNKGSRWIRIFKEIGIYLCLDCRNEIIEDKFKELAKEVKKE